jgi:hypothetical protein
MVPDSRSFRYLRESLGKKLNNDKTTMFFSCNTNPETKTHILTVVGVSATQSYEKYLGLPTLVGQSNVSTFSGIKGKMWE